MTTRPQDYTTELGVVGTSPHSIPKELFWNVYFYTWSLLPRTTFGPKDYCYTSVILQGQRNEVHPYSLHSIEQLQGEKRQFTSVRMRVPTITFINCRSYRARDYSFPNSIVFRILVSINGWSYFHKFIKLLVESVSLCFVDSWSTYDRDGLELIMLGIINPYRFFFFFWFFYR